MPAYRTEAIIAIPCGEAGNTLCLILPRVENYGWGMKSSVKLSLLEASTDERGYWVGTGGRIQQIICAGDDKSSSTWFAIRQLSMITIFRPLYHVSPIPAITPGTFGASHAPSNLGANPVAVLNAEQTGSNNYVDVSYNPYYARQFIVVDDEGSWSTWDIEGRKRLTLVPGKHGSIHDKPVDGSLPSGLHDADGWHQILWVTNVSTIAVCNRRSLVAFDITSTPRPLRSYDILSPDSTDWILDMKRSAVHLNHLFVLTSSRIFWLEVVTAGERIAPNSSGIKLILSYRHFRDPNDYTMKLVVLKDNEGKNSNNSDRDLINF